MPRPELQIILGAVGTPHEVAVELSNSEQDALLELVMELDLAVQEWGFTLKLAARLVRELVDYGDEVKDPRLMEAADTLLGILRHTYECSPVDQEEADSVLEAEDADPA